MWSLVNPVPEEVVRLLFLVQSYLSALSWVQPQRLESKWELKGPGAPVVDTADGIVDEASLVTKDPGNKGPLKNL